MTDEQKLWDLLGHAPRASAPPFFAARVLRTIRQPTSRHSSLLEAFLRWMAPAAVAALLLLAVLPRPEDNEAGSLAATDMTTLDLVGMLSPEDYQILTAAGWPEDSVLLTGSL
jgi:hypothetical protein